MSPSADQRPLTTPTPAQADPGGRRGILETTLFTVIAVAGIVSAIFILATIYVTDRRAHETSVTRLTELVESGAASAAIACYVNDDNLAKETARSLLKSSEVLGVMILKRGQIIAVEYRDRAASPRLQESREGRIRKPLYSPFSHSYEVGEIVLDTDLDAVQRTIRQETRYVALLLILLAFSVVVAVAIAIHYVVVRPVQEIARRTHALEVSGGQVIPAPKGHAGTELGRLVRDINELFSRLVRAIHDEKELRLRREMDERKYHAIFDNAEAGMFMIDQHAHLESFNPALERIFTETRSGPVKERKLTDLPWARPDRLQDMIALALMSDTPQSDDLELRVADQKSRWLHIILRPIGDNLVQGMGSDVTERRNAEQEAWRQLVTDKLTGLPNRNGFEAAFKDYLAPIDHSEPKPFALFLIDLDGFRRVNESMGLAAGDQILIAAAHRLCANVEANTVVGRINADEFVVMQPLLDQEDAARLGEKLTQVMSFNLVNESLPVHLGASIGISLYPQHGRDMPSLLRAADFAQMRAQAMGGSSFQLYDPGMSEAADQKRLLDADLRMAVRRKEFHLQFHPIVDLQSNRLVGAEALLRWQRGEHGILHPDAFIPAAEKNGAIMDLGNWVLEAACEQLARWQETELADLYISVNVSALQIPEGLPPSHIVESAARHGVSPAKLIFEITEGALLNDMAGAHAWLEAVRSHGFQVCIDDFGTGYSSLAYLKRFHVDTLKVDKSFVRDMTENSSDRKLVDAIVSMAHSLGLAAVAEGVENNDQLDLLRKMGCRYVQGFYFSNPVPASEFPETARNVNALLNS